MNRIDDHLRAKIAIKLDTPARGAAASVSKEWLDAIEYTWGPEQYGLPFAACSPRDPAAWKELCKLKHLATGLRPEDLDANCLEMSIIAAQVDGRAGKPSGERYILQPLVELGRYEDAMRYLQTYPAQQAQGGAQPMDAEPEGLVHMPARAESAQRILTGLLVHAQPREALETLIPVLETCCDRGFMDDLRERARTAPNPVLWQALNACCTQANVQAVYSGLRAALGRGDAEATRAWLLLHERLGRPPLGPLLDAFGARLQVPEQQACAAALVDAGVVGAPCVPSRDIIRMLDNSGDRAAAWRALMLAGKDAHGATWMHKLIQTEHGPSAFALMLCREGSSIFEPDAAGRSPLSMSADWHWRSASTAQFLESAPAPWPQGFEQLRVGDADGAYAYWKQALEQAPLRATELLRAASWTGDVACVRLALQHLDEPDERAGALSCARQRQHFGVAELLMAYGAPPGRHAIVNLSPDFVRRYVATRVSLPNWINEDTPDTELTALCALHTAQTPVVDRDGLTLPQAIVRAGRMHHVKAFFLGAAGTEFAPRDLVYDLLRAPISPNRYWGSVFDERALKLKLMDNCSSTPDPNMSFDEADFIQNLAEVSARGAPADLMRLWESHRNNGTLGPRVSALAWAAFAEFAWSQGNRLTKLLAQRGLRLQGGEKLFFAAWLKDRVRQGFMQREEHAIVDGLVSGGFDVKFRDSAGRTLLHLCRYEELFDTLVAHGADPRAIDYKRQMAQRPEGKLYEDDRVE